MTKLFFLLFSLNFMLANCHGQQLVLEEAQTRLPYPSNGFSAVFDEEDNIYILGGHNMQTPGSATPIYAYNLTSDSIFIISEIPQSVFGGGVIRDLEGNIFYIGGVGYSGNESDIYKFDPSTGTTTIEGRIGGRYLGSTLVKSNSSNTVYVIGGIFKPKEIVRINLTSMEWEIVNKNLTNGAALGFVQGNKAFIFGGEASPNSYVEIFNLETMESQMGHVNLPDFNGISTAVTDGRFGYIIGSWKVSDGFPINGIIKFDPLTLQSEFLPVENYMTGTESNYTTFSSATVVYVEKLNRIYIFGGYVEIHGFKGEIWFIDLSPLNPTTPTTEIIPTTMKPELFSCVNKTDGFYPNPLDCSKFIICVNEETTNYDCPAPNLFNPDLWACVSPDQMDCQITCSNKPNGNYPHPYDCSWYISCESEDLQVEQCPPPLLFHSDTFNCVPSQFVECNL